MGYSTESVVNALILGFDFSNIKGEGGFGFCTTGVGSYVLTFATGKIPVSIDIEKSTASEGDRTVLTGTMNMHDYLQ
jgi:hypothetical protein